MKEHLNDYEKRIWEGIDKDAEEIIKMMEADPEAMSAEPSEEMDRKIYAMIPGHEDADSEEFGDGELVRRRPGSTTSGQRVTEAEKKRKKRKNPEQKDDITGSGSQLRQQYWCL